MAIETWTKGSKRVRLLLVAGAAIAVVLLQACPSALQHGSTTGDTTGDITGHARFSMLSNHAGIVMSAEESNGIRTKTISAMVRTASGAQRSAIAAQTTTDTGGAYIFDAMPEGTYTIYASSPSSLERAVTTSVTVVAGRSVSAPDLLLTPVGAVSGVARVSGSDVGNLGIVVFIAGTSYSAMTDDAGNFTISGVPSGNGYLLVASKEGYSSATAPVDVAPGETTSVGNLNLALVVHFPTTGMISGSARLDGGLTGNDGIFVYLSGTSYITLTDDSGAYRLNDVAPGSYVLLASKIGYAQATKGPLSVMPGINTKAGIMELAREALVDTVAGSAASEGSANGTWQQARFNWPTGIAVDGLNLYISDMANATIRQLRTGDGVVSTVAGTPGSDGSTDGRGSSALFHLPRGLVVNGRYLYVVEFGNNTIRKVDTVLFDVTTLAGLPGTGGHVDGTGANARFWGPWGVATDGTYLYVTDCNNSAIRRITIDTGEVSTFAGAAITPGSIDGIGTAARFSLPTGIACDGENLYICDTDNSTIRKIVIATREVTTLAGAPGVTGSADGTGSAASFESPDGITTDGESLWVADYDAHTIRKIDIASGQVTTIAGRSGIPGSVDGPASSSLFNEPEDLVVTDSGIYVTDGRNNTIRRIN